ncbi:hypothetical protein Poly24_37190 [Rosistilla carotiformis]|uniref:Uncharacterized protein n=1 Tax=Rosistilla carotiformis TaxID=2528017 RepID=A0A518JWS9_9BACT|nr:hypothetical protein [Rosistilla carotiformis]QDV70000.1 hypothetical protein Poly24_37190 [Rosistilla carotiformis]
MSSAVGKGSSLIDPTFLFEFSVALKRAPLKWGKTGVRLDESYRIPAFGTLAGRPHYADLRMGWNENGIGFRVEVVGKAQMPWCREARVEESDGLHLYIDTRNSPGIHRANRYCHQFAFLPMGASVKRDQPVARMLNIHRARELPTPVDSDALQVHSTLKKHGYEMSGLIPAKGLTGYDPSEYPRISLWYAIVDREIGWQTLSLGPEYPCQEDPTLWATAELAKD